MAPWVSFHFQNKTLSYALAGPKIIREEKEGDFGANSYIASPPPP